MSVQAEVQPPDSPSFRATLANLTQSTVFVKTERDFPFRTHLLVRVAGLVLKSEVAFSVHAPTRGVVVTFRAEPAELKLLAQLVSHIEVIGASGQQEPWVERTVPGADEMSAEIVRPPPRDFQAPQHESTNDISAPWERRESTPYEETPFDQMGVHVPASAPMPRTVSQAKAAVGSELPTLKDGTLHFAKVSDFEMQWRSTIMHGGLIARSSPLTIGSQHVIKLSVGGAKDTTQISARVGYVGSGTVGFVIDGFAHEKPKLEALVGRLKG